MEGENTWYLFTLPVLRGQTANNKVRSNVIYGCKYGPVLSWKGNNLVKTHSFQAQCVFTHRKGPSFTSWTQCAWGKPNHAHTNMHQHVQNKRVSRRFQQQQTIILSFLIITQYVPAGRHTELEINPAWWKLQHRNSTSSVLLSPLLQQPELSLEPPCSSSHLHLHTKY